jgi:hypothetical protein
MGYEIAILYDVFVLDETYCFDPKASERCGYCAPLHWRLQLTVKPAVCSRRFHRVNQIGHNLVDVVARGALKRPDIEAKAAGRNPRQHCCCLTRWT